jgi:ABC-type glycerol-3-phosphate transport system permease component
MPASVMAMILAVEFFLALQRYFVRGIALSGLRD